MIETIIVAMGVFVISAFTIVIYLHKKRDIPLGYWPMVGATAAFVILAEIFHIIGNAEMHTFLVIVTLILFFILALLKYWDTMRTVEQ